MLNIPQVLITYSRSKFDDIEDFCIFLKQRKALTNHGKVLGAKYANMLWLLKHLDFSVPKENIDQTFNQRFGVYKQLFRKLFWCLLFKNRIHKEQSHVRLESITKRPRSLREKISAFIVLWSMSYTLPYR